MKEKILPFSVFLLALCLLPYSHQLLVKHEIIPTEQGEVAGVSTMTEANVPTWCEADSTQYKNEQKQNVLAQYQKTVQSYKDIETEYPQEKKDLDRLIESEYQHYIAKLSALESQNEAMESASCRDE